MMMLPRTKKAIDAQVAAANASIAEQKKWYEEERKKKFTLDVHWGYQALSTHQRPTEGAERFNEFVRKAYGLPPGNRHCSYCHQHSPGETCKQCGAPRD